MGNTLKTLVILGMVGAAAAGLVGCAKKSGAKAKVPDARAQPVTDVASQMKRVDAIRQLAHKYVIQLKETEKRYGINQAEYERRLYADEINDSLLHAGYMGMVPTSDTFYALQPNNNGLQLLDRDSFFAKDYFKLRKD